MLHKRATTGDSWFTGGSDDPHLHFPACPRFPQQEFWGYALWVVSLSLENTYLISC